MTKADLLKALEQYPDDMQVIPQQRYGGYSVIGGVCKVQMLDDNDDFVEDGILLKLSFASTGGSKEKK